VLKTSAELKRQGKLEACGEPGIYICIAWTKAEAEGRRRGGKGCA